MVPPEADSCNNNNREKRWIQWWQYKNKVNTSDAANDESKVLEGTHVSNGDGSQQGPLINVGKPGACRCALQNVYCKVVELFSALHLCLNMIAFTHTKHTTYHLYLPH